MAPDILNSTREEREEYIKTEFKCKNNCELCGLCRVFRGKDAVEVYEKYIEGECSFEEISQTVR